MSAPSGSNIDSTHQNIEQLVQRIAALQKEEEATQQKLLAHEETRNDMCSSKQTLDNQEQKCRNAAEANKVPFFKWSATDDAPLGCFKYNWRSAYAYNPSQTTEWTAGEFDASPVNIGNGGEEACRQAATNDKTVFYPWTNNEQWPTGCFKYPEAAYGFNPAKNTTWRVEDEDSSKRYPVKLENTHIKEKECLFKQNGADAYSKQLMDQIQRLANERAELFKTLLNIYATVQRDVAETRSDLVDQMTVVGVVEKELTNARGNLEALSKAKNNKNRMALINTYYGKKYQAHTGIMKMIIMICVPLLILAIVGKKGFIGENITRPLALIIIIVGGLFLFWRIWDLSSRDNMNYDEYNWDFDPNNVKPTVIEYDREQLDDTDMGARISNDLHTLASDLGVECIGPNCCSKGMRYDQKLNKCVKDNNASHHHRAAADAKTQSEAFEIMRPVEGTSYVAPPDCHSMPTTVRPYESLDEEQYEKVA